MWSFSFTERRKPQEQLVKLTPVPMRVAVEYGTEPKEVSARITQCGVVAEVCGDTLILEKNGRSACGRRRWWPILNIPEEHYQPST